MKIEKLGKYVFQIRGLSYKPNQISKEPKSDYCPVLKANNITEDGLDESDLIYINEKLIKKPQFIKKGDILIAASSGSKKVIGKNIYFSQAYSGSFGAFCKVIRPKPSIHPEYLKHFFKTNYYKQAIISQVQGANINNLKARDIDDLLIPLPSFTDQQRIAKVLSHCEQIIAWRKESIDLLDDYLESVFLEMFGDPATNPKGFKLRKLSEFYITPKDGTKCGPFGSALKKAEYVDSGIPVWNMDNISKRGRFISKVNLWVTEDKFDQLEKYSTRDGDIIISRAGTVGKMCVLSSGYQQSIISTNLIRLRLNESKLLPLYFVSLMNYFKGRVGRLKTGPDGGFTHMNTGILDKLQFPYPPMEIQVKFQQIFSHIRNIETKMKESHLELKDLYESISNQAFAGKLSLEEIEVKLEESSSFSSISNTRTEVNQDKKSLRFKKYLKEKRVKKQDIRELSLMEFFEIPEELYAHKLGDDYGPELHFIDMDLFYQFFLKDNFQDQGFTFFELGSRFNNYYIPKGGDFNPHKWKEMIFKFLNLNRPLLRQVFDENTGSVKLELTDEAFKA